MVVVDWLYYGVSVEVLFCCRSVVKKILEKLNLPLFCFVSNVFH